MKRAPRVVLDTNVVLSALVFTHGRSVALREAWHGGRCEPLVSKATVDELIRVLGYPKFKLVADEQHELLADYLPYCRTVTIPAKAPRTPLAGTPSTCLFCNSQWSARRRSSSRAIRIFSASKASSYARSSPSKLSLPLCRPPDAAGIGIW